MNCCTNNCNQGRDCHNRDTDAPYWTWYGIVTVVFALFSFGVIASCAG